jgi:predicted transcriptional regulator
MYLSIYEYLAKGIEPCGIHTIDMIMDNKIDFSKVLKVAMDKKKLTQLEFSNKLGIRQSQISNWLNKKSLPGYYSIRQICLTLDISADELLELN